VIGVELLLADDDARLRSLVAERIREEIGPVTLLEARDGAEALGIGLERRPAIALLDIAMPRLDGIEAAVALRAEHPSVRLALHTSDATAHRARAAEHGLALFEKLQLEEAIDWLREAAVAVRAAA
jgi:two-component system, NarL family, response regulator DesR